MQSDGLTAYSTEAFFVASTVYWSRVAAASPSYHHCNILRMVIAVITIYNMYTTMGLAVTLVVNWVTLAARSPSWTTVRM